MLSEVSKMVHRGILTGNLVHRQPKHTMVKLGFSLKSSKVIGFPPKSEHLFTFMNMPAPMAEWSKA